LKNKNVLLYISFVLVFLLCTVFGYFFGIRQVKAPPVESLGEDEEVINVAVADITPSPVPTREREKVGYLIREYERHVALFEVYNDNSTVLVNLTETPSERLRHEDIELIKKGIFIKDYEEAQKTLENFLN